MISLLRKTPFKNLCNLCNPCNPLQTSSSTFIVVMLDPDFGLSSRVMDGVRQEVQRHGMWNVLPLTTSQGDLLATLVEREQVAGVIGSFLSDRWVREFCEGIRIPVVNIGETSDIRSVPTVRTDNLAVGTLAGRHLLETGAAAYAVVQDSASYASRLRAEGFEVALAAAGVPNVLTPPRPGGYAPDDDWGLWAAAQPHPLAVFCTDDFLARRFIRRVRKAELRVPEDVAVLGVGDSPVDTVLSPIPLSSICIPAERIGKNSARILISLLNLENKESVPYLLPPEGVSVRESSSLRKGVCPLVSRALAYFERNLGSMSSVVELARACHVSRRSLETAFRHDLNRSPGEELRRMRMERAKQLLEGTDLPLNEVAERCGYPNAPWFWTRFRRDHGCTPLQYRLHVRSAHI